MGDVSAQLLKVRPGLPDRIRQGIDEVLQRYPLNAPKVQVEYTGQQAAAPRRATSVLVKRGDPKAMSAADPKNDDAAAPLVVWVNSKEIDLEHVRLTFTEGKWRLYSVGGGVLGLPKTPARPVEVAPGTTWQPPEPAFSFRIRSFKFNFTATDMDPAKVDSIKKATKDPSKDEVAQAITFDAVGSVFNFFSPKDFWLGKENIRDAILEEVWGKIAQEFSIQPRPPLVIPAKSSAAVGSTPERFSIQIKTVDGLKTFHIDVPDSFCRSLVDKGKDTAGPLQWEQLLGETRWRRLFCIGEQDLTLDQLKTLGPARIVVLSPNSAYIVDMDLDRQWKLTPKGALFAQDKTPFSIGTEIRASFRSGGFMQDSLDVGQLQVRLQVILSSQEMSISDLQRYAPGQDVLLDVKEGSDVAIAINGRLLGVGKLVRLPDGRLGVKILHWNV